MTHHLSAYPLRTTPPGRAWWPGLLLCIALGSPARAAQQPGSGDASELANLSIEQLMNESVTSVSKHEQKLGDVASAIFVLSNDDLRRSGFTTVAEALRLVPGVDVAAVNASQSAISVRGFNSVYANKLLALVDGRAVYSPIFAGTYWDLQQTMLDDVDRIEVIRGPGAAVWGANAVNGVINIVTRTARDTQGGLIYGGGGDVHQAMAGSRYGGQLGENTYYRVFGSYQLNDSFPLADGSPAGDRWKGGQGGMRLDHYPRPDTHLTWQADATLSNLEAGADHGYNANTLGRWTRQWSPRSSVEVQAYYDRTYRNEDERARGVTDTADLTFQHNFGLGERNDLTWGLGYRFIHVAVEQTNPALQVRDPRANLQLFSVFIQDEFKLIPDKLALTAGVKLERNDFTGLEIQPSVRAAFKPTATQTLWSAVSRAVRTPDLLEKRDLFGLAYGAPFQGPGGGQYVPTIVGNPAIRSEVLWAYEAGYRFQASRRVSADIAAFYNRYSDLIEVGSISRFVPGNPVGAAELPWTNSGRATTAGGEVSLGYVVTDAWRLTASYSLLSARRAAAGGASTYDRSSPRHQANLRSSYDFGNHFSLDSQLRYVGPIQSVSAYLTADLRFSYRPTERVELSVVGQNLLDEQHPEEAAQLFVISSEVPRGIYGRLAWRF